MRPRRSAGWILLIGTGVTLAAGCARTTNLLNPDMPRFSGNYASTQAAAEPEAPLRVVTFNIKLAREINRAVAVLQSDSLRGADILALEEMDDVGTERIARALRLNYVYYPGSIHPTDHKYFGPAILTRWPVEKSWKLLLPHEGLGRHQRRTATAADLRIGGHLVRVYAVHLETQLKVSEAAREDQVGTVLEDAADFQGPVVIAGDFNSYGIGPLLVRKGYRWTTEMVGSSIAFFSWDHIFVRGLLPARPASAGVVRNVDGASDHHPVWAVVVPEAPAALTPGPVQREITTNSPRQPRSTQMTLRFESAPQLHPWVHTASLSFLVSRTSLPGGIGHSVRFPS
jgi:endonuclease/exonuclease/phosphatase family metal-dependent hydrolase